MRVNLKEIQNINDMLFSEELGYAIQIEKIYLDEIIKTFEKNNIFIKNIAEIQDKNFYVKPVYEISENKFYESDKEWSLTSSSYHTKIATGLINLYSTPRAGHYRD